jgi:hypothetical protein
VQKDKESGGDSNSNLLISIQRGHCEKKCPVYEANFYSDKRMTYQGTSKMPLLGSYSFLIPNEVTKNLIFEAVKLKLNELPEKLPIPADVPVTTIRIVINGKMKQISGYATKNKDPFSQFVSLLHSEVYSMITEQEGQKTE